MPEMTTTKAPVGPPIWGGRSADAGDEKAGDDRAVDSSLRVGPEAMAKAMPAQGDQAYGDSGIRSRRNLFWL